MTDTQADGITIQPELNLPPDGTYPPRLLSKSIMMWLSEDKSYVLHKAFTITRNHDKCYVSPSRTRRTVKLNGEPITEIHQLKNGDFIQYKKEVMIYQADPVKDYRLAIHQNHYTRKIFESPIHLSVNLAKHVIMDSEGISLNGGENKLMWGNLLEIISYRAQDENTHQFTKCNFEILGYLTDDVAIIHDENQLGWLPNTLTLLDEDEFNAFIALMLNNIPFIPSVKSHIPHLDAYVEFTNRLHIVPYLMGTQALPLPMKMITGKSNDELAFQHKAMEWGCLSWGLIGLLGLLFKNLPLGVLFFVMPIGAIAFWFWQREGLTIKEFHDLFQVKKRQI